MVGIPSRGFAVTPCNTSPMVRFEGLHGEDTSSGFAVTPFSCNYFETVWLCLNLGLFYCYLKKLSLFRIACSQLDIRGSDGWKEEQQQQPLCAISDGCGTIKENFFFRLRAQ